MTAPSPSVRLKEKLDSFLSLPEGWDSYGASRISERTIAKAKEFIDLLPGEDWQVVPISTGAVQFEQHKDDFEIEVYIEAV